MTRRSIVVAGALLLAVTAAGCSSSATKSPQATEKSILDQAHKTATGIVGGSGGKASSVTCVTDYQTISDALDVYRAAESKEPTKMTDLVPSYLRDPPKEWELFVGTDGVAHIRPNALGRTEGCTVPPGG